MCLIGYTAYKVLKYGVFSGPYFPVLGLNTEIYKVNLQIQSEYRKIMTRKTLHLDTFKANYFLFSNYLFFKKNYHA